MDIQRALIKNDNDYIADNQKNKKIVDTMK